MKRLFAAIAAVLLVVGTTRADEAAEIRARTAARRPVIVELVKAGAIAEAATGFLTVKDATALGDKAPVVEAENKDRRTAYEQIAKATGLTPEEVGRRQAARIRAQAGR